MTDFTPQNMMEAVSALQKAVKENNEGVVTKVSSFIDSQEKKNQELVKQLEAEKAE